VPSATTTRIPERLARWGLAVLLSVALPASTAGGQAVVVGHGDRAVAQIALPADGRFALTYRHSVYEVTATERFVAEQDGRLRLVGVSSPSEAVLDYYGVEGTRRRDAQGWHLELADAPRFDELPLIATEIGERTLAVGDREVRLSSLGTHLSIAATRSART
jgi:hypothetical protein